MNQWWQLWTEFFTPDECRKIIEVGLLREATEATIGHGGPSNKDTNIRRSVVRWLDRRDDELVWIMQKVEYAFQVANANAFQFDLTYFHEVQFTEYTDEQEGKYDWHEDLTWTRNSPSRRKLSIVTQLSPENDYTGGDLEVSESQVNGKENLPDKDALRKQGSVFVFPSFLTHRVTPLVRGKRYSLVSWYEGPPFR